MIEAIGRHVGTADKQAAYIPRIFSSDILQPNIFYWQSMVISVLWIICTAINIRWRGEFSFPSSETITKSGLPLRVNNQPYLDLLHFLHPPQTLSRNKISLLQVEAS